MDEFQGMTVPQLREFLNSRGVPNSGKRRQELETLARKANEAYTAREACDRAESERKRRCVRELDGSVRDLNGRTVAWTKDLKKLPSITCTDVFVYLSVDCAWTPERMKRHKEDDGYRMYIDNHVEEVELGTIQGENKFMYVRGRVRPEQRQTASRYSTWILCASSGEVKSAGCGCVAAYVLIK